MPGATYCGAATGRAKERGIAKMRFPNAQEIQPVTPIDRLLDIMTALRDPDHGCPWDREQNFASVAPYTIEEAFEVADAIARGDMEDLCDELGDLLLQVVFHAQMGREQGAFDFDDVANAISDKLERRHPHVFENEEIGSVEEQSRAWEAHKKAERAARGRGHGHSILDAVHGGRPALQHATELQRATATQGFDWRDAVSVLPKLREELGELETALLRPDGHEQAVEELGDLFFTCVNLARHLGVDADGALRRASTKFEIRFRRVEKGILEQGRSLQDATLTEMDALWELAKRAGTD
jgi:MazG family protein